MAYRIPLRLKSAVYESYVRPAILYECEALCLMDSEVEIVQRTERFMMRAISGVQLKDRKRYTDLMFMLVLEETIDQLAMTNSVRWYGHVLRRVDGQILRRALDFEAEGQRKKGRPNSTLKMQIEDESVNVECWRKQDCCLI